MGLNTRRRLGVLFWVAGLGVAMTWGTLSYDDGSSVRGLGYAQSVIVASPDHGRLASIEVQLHDLVAPDAIVAKLDDTALASQREVLSAEFLAIADAGEGDPEEMMDDARKRAQTLRTRAELATVDSQLAQMKKLLEDGAASPAEVSELETRRRALHAKLLERGNVVEKNSRVNAWQVVAALKRIESLDASVEALSLRAAIGGQVAELLHTAGDVVQRGDPILRVTPPETQEVIAWVPMNDVPEPGSGSKVVRGDGSVLLASVVSVGVGPTLVAPATLLDPRRPEWGVAVRLKLTEGSIKPDEPVTVRL